MKDKILAALADVLKKMNVAVAHHYKTEFPMLEVAKVDLDGIGPRYVRVSHFRLHVEKNKYYAESVYFFVDLTNGNVLKPASYKAAEKKNPRGTIFDDNILTKFTPYGICYIRGGNCGDTLQTLHDNATA